MGGRLSLPVVHTGREEDAEFVARGDRESFPINVEVPVSFGDPDRIRAIVNNPNSLHKLRVTNNGYMIYTPWPQPEDPGVVYVTALGGPPRDKLALIRSLQSTFRRVYTHAKAPRHGESDPYGYWDFITAGFRPGMAGNVADEPRSMGFDDSIRNLVTLNWERGFSRHVHVFS